MAKRESKIFSQADIDEARAIGAEEQRRLLEDIKKREKILVILDAIDDAKVSEFAYLSCLEQKHNRLEHIHVRMDDLRLIAEELRKKM